MAHRDWLNDCNWHAPWASTRCKLACAFLLGSKLLCVKWHTFWSFYTDACFWEVKSWSVPGITTLGTIQKVLLLFWDLPYACCGFNCFWQVVACFLLCLASDSLWFVSLVWLLLLLTSLFVFRHSNSLVSALTDLSLLLACRLMFHMLGNSFFSMCLILAALKSVVTSDKHIARNSWSCKLNKNMCLDRMLVISWGCLHMGSCFCTLFQFIYTGLSFGNDLRRPYHALSILPYGLQNPLNLNHHNVSVEIPFGSKHQAWYISKPWSPNYLRSVLLFLLSGKPARSAPSVLSHLSFHVLNLEYKESSTDQSMTRPSIN